MKKFFLSFILIAFVCYAHAQRFYIDHGGVTRSYILHLPTGYNPANSHSLVLNFHGLNMTGSQLQSRTGMDAISNANNFIVVYPDGLNNSWNAGINNGNVDDVGFVNTLINALTADYSINAEKIYATGYSMGGYFSYRLACRLSEKIAAIAPVSGLMADINNCGATRSVPVMHIHGTSDWLVPYSNVSSVLNYWRTENNCTADPQITSLPNSVDLIVYGGCADNTEVRHYRLNGKGHAWPSTSTSINASQEIWNFLSRFSLSTDPSNPAPEVSITSPANNASFNAPATITLSANASDENGSIAKVEFYEGTTKLGEDLTSPYTYNWTNVQQGSYDLTAKATDNQGAQTTSSVISVSVTLSGEVCTTTPPYSSNDEYEVGSLVKNYDRIYECRSASRCNGASWAYAPGAGYFWRYAWTYIENCSDAITQQHEISIEATDPILYPNPARDELTIRFASPMDTEIKVSVSSVYDSNILEERVDVVAGENKVNLDVTKLQKGMYIVHLTIGNKNITKTIYVSK